MTMPDHPTPGQVCYETWCAMETSPHVRRWTQVHREEQRAWEAAAQAVQPPFRFALGQRVRWAESVQTYRVEGRSYEERVFAAPVILYRVLLEGEEDFLTEDALEAHLSPVEDDHA